MPTIFDVISASSGDLIRGVLDAAARGTVIVGAAALAGLLLKRASAEARHLVWAFALAALVALPVLSRALPDWRVAVPAVTFRQVAAAPAPGTTVPVGAGSARAAFPPVSSMTPPLVDASASTLSNDPSTVPGPSGAAPPVIPVTTWLFAIWVSGIVLVVAAIAVGMFRLWRFERGARPVADPAVQRLADVLCRDLGITRRVRLLEREGPVMPMTWGVLWPRVLVPVGFGDWPLERRRDVLVHELAHVRRFDCLTQLLARLTCAFYWFHPLVWAAAAQLRLERERACDDQVLAAGARASDYANHLLEIAHSLRSAGVTSIVSIAMARPSQLSGRLLAVLDARRPRRATRGITVAAFTAALGIVLPVAALRPQTEQAEDETHDARIEKRETGSTIGEAGNGSRETSSGTRLAAGERKGAIASISSPPVAPPVVAFPNIGQAGLLPELNEEPWGAMPTGNMFAITTPTLECRWSDPSGSHSTSHNVDDDHTTIRWRSGDCVLLLQAEGKFEFTDDESEIKSLSPGGRFELIERDGNRERELVVTADRSGRRTVVWKLDGNERPFDSDARAWLASMIPEIMRRTGIDAKARVQRILARGGAQAVLTEIGLLRSDYVRRLYYTELLSSQRLDNATLERVVKQAGTEIGSDYELAELLIAISNDYPLDGATRHAYIAASESLQSDYEHRRVLGTVLNAGELSPAALNDFLASATNIGSDYELAELLVAVSRQYVVSDALRQPFFDAVNTIGSDYEHRRVLHTIVGKGPLTPAVLGAVLASAGSIKSDYEAAELLIGVAGDNAINDATAPAYMAVVGSLSSDYERRRAMSAVLKREGSSQVMVRAVLESAKGVRSSYERAELLLEVLRYGLDASLRDLFIDVTEGISSAHDRDRVLSALVRRKGGV